ncbi:protein of unknown function [Vibrio tapetis subsp. tapetis]|uniref:Uncharacterized protein n=1 Tax=Vibrio tapetis subsp. tapetis TaxID=1671868 RepID=A0A2N8Z9M4_9VIBR|nr:protein of unknown function [Vibrio tapetis subsp. tapetis]
MHIGFIYARMRIYFTCKIGLVCAHAICELRLIGYEKIGFYSR